jgi:predicted amidohydrolase YtcJ
MRAAAAAATSVPAGPPQVHRESQLISALLSADRALAPGEWLRAVGYHESVAGHIDRFFLDHVVPHRPVRVQHRSGILWVLNSAALLALDARRAPPTGLQVDLDGEPTGRLWREDEWLRSRTPARDPDLSQLSAAAARQGVTGFTDATPHGHVDDLTALVEAVVCGRVLQRLHVMSAPGVVPAQLEGAALGPAKVILDDDRLPPLPELVEQVSLSHRGGRPVAIHCVTRIQAVLAIAAIEAAGTIGTDRIEHGAVLDAALLASLSRLGLTVVTQPGFVYSRGDRYFEDVDPADQPDLWRLGSLVDAGVSVAAGSDAPFGPDDPWVAIRAAVDRTTAGGRRLGAPEGLGPAEALRLWQGTASRPALVRELRPGQPADVCILSEPFRSAARLPTVTATVIAGRVVYEQRR